MIRPPAAACSSPLLPEGVTTEVRGAALAVSPPREAGLLEGNPRGPAGVPAWWIVNQWNGGSDQSSWRIAKNSPERSVNRGAG